MPAKRKSSTDVAASRASKRTKRDSTLDSASSSDKNLRFNLEWKDYEMSKHQPDLIYLDGPDAKPSTKIAGFDIDSTIIRTKSGRRFATGRSDWVFFDEKKVPEKLKELHDGGTKIVFFTNQAGIEKGNTDIDTLEGKFEDIINALGIPLQIFISTGNSHFRKPSPEMWHFMESHCNGGLTVDLEQSIYVGDAAGRPKDWRKGKPKDFSCSDRMFAANVGVPFATPETYFQGLPEAPFEWSCLDASKFLDSLKDKTPPEKLHKDSQEVVLLVGRPASGKSTLSKRYFTCHGYVSVNRDTQGTKEKCLKIAAEALKNKKSVVVDNTNPKKEDRKVYIELAKKHSVPVRCLYLKMSSELSYHLNMFRQNLSKGAERRVPMVAYHTFNKYFEEPEQSEGFSEVSIVDFVPSFDSKSNEEQFKHWTNM